MLVQVKLHPKFKYYIDHATIRSHCLQNGCEFFIRFGFNLKMYYFIS